VPKLDDSFRVLAHAFPRWNLTADAIRTWAAMLSDVDPDALYAAAVQFATESDFPPSIAELRKRVASLTGAAGSTATKMTTGEAWDEVLRNRELSSRQRYESRPERRKPYVWSSEAVRIAAEAVGWNRDWDEESAGTTRAQFERYLGAMVSKGAAIEGAKSALEFAPQVEALLERPMLRRVEDRT
jgi:hypothetical protein